MSEPLQPFVAVELSIFRDAGDGPDEPVIVRAARRPLPDADRFMAGLVTAWDPIRRELSDDQGAPRMSTGGVTLNDDIGGELRGAMAENPQRFVTRTEASVQVLSQTGRAAGLDWRFLLRGRVDEAAVAIERNGVQRRRQVRMSFVDVLAPYYDRYINDRLFLRSNFPDIDRAIENTPIPLVIGEISDAGAEDINGDPAEKGMVPLVYVGTYQTVDDDPLSGEAAYLSPPAGLVATVNGTAGTAWRYYGVTKLSAVGETTLSAVLLVDNTASALSNTNSVTFNWTPDANATGWIVYRGLTPTPSGRIGVIASGATTTFTDIGYSASPPGPPATNTAQIPGVDGSFRWDMYVVGRGQITILDLFGSNVAEGVTPARISLLETAGVDFLIPGYSGWPHDELTVIIGGDELTVIYGRGPRSQHHIDGVVTLAANVCGMAGDDGVPINGAFLQLQHVLTQFVPTDGGASWTSGDWLPLREFAGATPTLQASAFQDCQDISKQFMDDDEGYLGAIYIREPITLRDLLQAFLVTFDCFWTTNHHGQGLPVLVNPFVPAGDVSLYRERMEIARLEDPQLDRSNVEPRVSFQYDYDPDAGAFRSEVEVVQDAEAVAAQPGNYRDRGTRQLLWTRHAATARDAQGRRVQRLKYPRWVQPFVTKFRGLEDEPGGQVDITHRDGPDENGWTQRRCYISAHVATPGSDEVLLTTVDYQPLLDAYADSEMDEDGDEDGAVLDFVMV